MKAHKLTVSKMAARFLWLRLQGHTYNTEDLLKVGPVFTELESLRPFNRRMIEHMKEANGDNERALELADEINKWEETWAPFELLVSPDSFDLVKERWHKVRKIDERGQPAGMQDAEFALQELKVVCELKEAFDKSEEVTVGEK